MPRTMTYAPSGRTGSHTYYNQDGPGNTTVDYGPHRPRDMTPSFTPVNDPNYFVRTDPAVEAQRQREIDAAHAQNRAAMAADPAYAAAAARGDTKAALARQVQMKQENQRQRFMDQGGTGATWDNRYSNENNWPRPTSSIGYSHGPGRPDYATRGTNPVPYGPGNTAPPVQGRAGAMSYAPASTGSPETGGGDSWGGFDPNGFVNVNGWRFDPANRQWVGNDWGDSNSLADYKEVAQATRDNGNVVPWDPSMGYDAPSSPGGRYDPSLAGGPEPAGTRDWWNTQQGMAGINAARAKRGMGPANQSAFPSFSQFTGKPMPSVTVDGYNRSASAPQATARTAQADIARTGPSVGLPTGPRTPTGPYTPTTVDPTGRGLPSGGINSLMALYGLNSGGMNASMFGSGNFGMPGGGAEGFLRFGGYRPAFPQGMMYAY